MLYQYLWDDVARKHISPEQLKKMQKGEQVEFIEDRQGNSNIRNKLQLKRTLSSKATNNNVDGIHMQNMARAPRDDEGPGSPVRSGPSPNPFGDPVEREPLSAEGSDSKRLTM